MNLSARIATAVSTLKARLGSLVRWLDAVLSDPPLDERDAQRHDDDGHVFQQRDI